FSSRRRHTRFELVTGVQTCALPICDEQEDERGVFHRARPAWAVTATTLFRRPKPSSTAGAPGSATQRCPSTTNAYWCCPTGSARVVVQMPLVPAGTSGAAFWSH